MLKTMVRKLLNSLSHVTHGEYHVPKIFKNFITSDQYYEFKAKQVIYINKYLSQKCASDAI